MYKDIIHFFVLSCHKATYLMEKRMHTKLTLIERIQIRMHLSLCGYCKEYEKDAVIIDKAIRKIAAGKKAHPPEAFTKEEISQVKQRILDQIRNQETK